MTLAQKVRGARRLADLTMRDLAALSDVSEATISRIEAGRSVPLADAYLRILRALGCNDVGDWLEPVSRPSAVWAARWLLGDLHDRPDGADEWIEAWQKIGLVSTGLDVVDPETLAFRAGRAATLFGRPGTVTGLSRLLGTQIGSRLADAGVEHAVTGDEALSRLGSAIVPVWPVVYVSDVRAACQALEIAPKLPDDSGPQVSLVPFDGWSEAGRKQASDGLWLASPTQALIDGYGGYGRMTQEAENVYRASLKQR